MAITITQSVAILIDGNNIERSVEDMTNKGTMVNFDTLVPRLLGGRSLNRLIYFREGVNISSKLAERLHEMYYGTVVPCHKSADIPLTIKATQLAGKVDTIIILSGDADYVDLVKHLRHEGVRVEIAAVEKNTARILKEAVDFYTPITKDDVFAYKGKKRIIRPRSSSPKPAQKTPQVKKPEAKPIAKKPVEKKTPAQAAPKIK